MAINEYFRGFKVEGPKQIKSPYFISLKVLDIMCAELVLASLEKNDFVARSLVLQKQQQSCSVKAT